MKYLLIIALFSILIFVSCDDKETMPELLEKTAENQFFVPENIYASSVRAAYFDSISQVAPKNQKERYNLKKARALLYAGKTEDAITILENLREASSNGLLLYKLDAHEEESIGPLLALAYMRLGEQQNCIHHHDASASCIIPIKPNGFHQVPKGSRSAIKLYEEFLRQNSHDYNSRWLLNIAYMTLGEYPEGVPEKWLIPESVFESDYPLKKFEDIAPELGLNVNELSGGGIVDDFNNDHLLDVLVSSWSPSDNLRYFINNGDGTFTEKTKSAGLELVTGGLNMVQADYNNDGFLDVFVMRGAWMGTLGEHPNSLLKNNGDGTFTDVTIEAGLLSLHPTQTATWADFDNDGWIDLFIGNESEKDNIHPCEFYRNNGDGTFSNLTSRIGLTVSTNEKPYYVKGVTSGDYNNDGWMDIYISTLQASSKNLLFLNNGTDNNGNISFTEAGSTAGLGEEISSFPTWSFDYNNDGWMDIFVAGYRKSDFYTIVPDIIKEYLGERNNAETMRLYKNNKGTFTDVSSKVGLKKIGYAMGANYGDLDNDGYPDIYLSTGEVSYESIIPNRVFRNNSGNEFQDVTTAGGFGHIQKGHAVSFSDIDNDGDQDIHVVMGGAYEGDKFFNSLYLNPYQSENNWISLKLEGIIANRAAIGSKIEVKVMEDGRIRSIFHTISSGGSFGCSTLRAQIGLGKASEIQQVKIKWAGSGNSQVFQDLNLNTFYKIIENKAEAEELDLNPISL
ncbi:CRTAC1 family protein [Salegentibacter salegens]|uniref:Repeat domain-containing protein n=1 Tax=Salegentibacter salegens TaxID=143223 RepID=A0A1M7IZY8_9FLAO|nr:CRTAC1 family protein [Salegentibacter salegens]PRX49875.1 VCBS repeat protein [Salegentibacter salegens]SHM46349.1 Repeat domain-containing protein [Salegentibacter salegens]